ncbi:MAG: hypothetical protein EOO54_20040 [Haliea sp.]|nr:MAG: hypothetical protein EOO54_20040 [Haliea sp.]
MHSILFKALLAVLLLAGSLAQGQTIVQDQGNTQVTQLGAESPLGQSFVATLTVKLPPSEASCELDARVKETR